MDGRDDKIYEEAAALWRALHGEPPPPEADGAMVLDLLLADLPETSPYERLANPHLRPAAITFPKRA
ncbi:MAG TPA: hypothetical protein VF495_18525 [Phenylobacterium sp.]